MLMASAHIRNAVEPAFIEIDEPQPVGWTHNEVSQAHVRPAKPQLRELLPQHMRLLPQSAVCGTRLFQLIVEIRSQKVAIISSSVRPVAAGAGTHVKDKWL